MQCPRFVHPNYIQQQPQWSPGMPRFRGNWPMLHRNRSPNYHSKDPRNFTNNEEHWCETCDRGFRTVQLLENHKQQHQKCNIDGCQFVAHPKVITKHIQMQHSTGLFKKISKLDNPEEIKKWREERKKKYPTKENIEKKSAEIKEKIERGEKMALKYNRENKFQRSEQGIKRKYSNENNQRQKVKRRFGGNESTELIKSKTTLEVNKKPLPKKIDKIVPPEDDKKALKPFTGILHLLDDTDNDKMEEPQNSDLIEDDEYTLDVVTSVNDPKPTEPLVCGALSSLICSYECSDDEENTEVLETNVTEVIHNKPTDTNDSHNNSESLDKSSTSVNPIIINSKSDDDSGPEETKVVKETDIPSNTVQNSNITQCPKAEKPKRIEKRTIHDSRHIRNDTKRFKSKLPSTLLEKLLHNEIRQERNIILQCIRYVVSNNYFEKTVN